VTHFRIALLFSFRLKRKASAMEEENSMNMNFLANVPNTQQFCSQELSRTFKLLVRSEWYGCGQLITAS
jgi:hypothetical protein